MHSASRVLMVVENNSYTRDTRVRQEARALTEAGYRMTVIGPRAPGRPWREVLDGVTLYSYRAPRPGDGILGYLWEYGYSLVAILALSWIVFFREGFDAIHLANPPDILVLAAAPFRLLGRRIVFDQHDLAPEMYGARFDGEPNRLMLRLLTALEWLSYRLAHHVIVTNSSYWRVAMERGELPPERITVVRNGPDTSLLRPVEPREGVRDGAGALLGYVGVMGYQDGVDHLLQALAHLVHGLGRPQVRALLVGAGDALANLQALAQGLGLDGHVRFTGWVSHAEVAGYLSATDICVAPEPSNPYNDRCTMIKLMEYMAMGKPIVAYDLPEHRVTAGEAALYATPGSPEALAEAMAQLIDAPERRAEMARIGQERIHTALAWEHQKRVLVEAYRTRILPLATPQPARPH